LARPFFFLCLLEDSSPLSNSGLGFLPLALGDWAAGCGFSATSLTASGDAAGFSAAGSAVELTGPTAWRPPFSLGLAVLDGAGCDGPGGAAFAPGVRISTPMELPAGAEAAGAALVTLVTAAVPAPAVEASAAGTS